MVGGFWAQGQMINSLEVYDPATNSWDWASEMPTARRFLASGVIDGKLYVAGGDDSGSPYATLEVFDPAGGGTGAGTEGGTGGDDCDDDPESEDCVFIDHFTDGTLTDQETVTVDLLEWQGTDNKIIVEGIELPAGEYGQLRLSVIDEDLNFS